VSEDELFELCWGRTGSVFDSLKKKAGTNAKFKNILERISAIRISAAKKGVFSFYFDVIEVLGLRQDFISYFGTQINEILDEFLNIIKNYETNNSPLLQQFIGWFERNDIEIKRNLNNTEGEVRILTVHGAKGLEAPIVILPDTTSTNDDRARYRFGGGLFLCPIQKEYRNALYEDISKNEKQKADAEYYRLLYVALTRAQDELYVFGYKPKKTTADNWHNIIMQAASEIASKTEHGYIYTDENYSKNEETGAQPVAHKNNIITFKKYIEPNEIEFISPSSLYGVVTGDKLNLQNVDFTRGLAIHKLLEILPEIDAARRDAAANIILRNYTELDEPQKTSIKDEAFAVLANKEFDFVFGGNSKAEVPICGIFEDKFISGKIDRLIEKGDELIVIDYKTNKVNEAKINELAEKYRAQLEAYRTLLGKIYDNRQIKTGLLFTSINKIHYYD
jgi:ATP-dependent helicase/nuclease subunit A